MKENQEIRWEQRLNNYQKALAQLEEGIRTAQNRTLNKLEQEGLVQRFEYTHELSWKVMKDYLEYQGFYNLTGSRDAIREASKNSLIHDGEVWMEMVKSRNLTSHTYDEGVAEMMIERIIKAYFPLFLDFSEKMKSLRSCYTA